MKNVFFLMLIILPFVFFACGDHNDEPSNTNNHNKTTVTVNGVSFNMIKVNGGTFTMGASNDDTEAEDWWKPAHQVSLSSFSIGETEVTQELWQAVMQNNPSKYKGNSQLPVESVSWYTCQQFIKRLNELTGKKFRLPTEAEWEFAARGGVMSKGYKYSGSNNIGDVTWYELSDVGTTPTKSVAGRSPNELGIYDMSGNVMEWCQDFYNGVSGYSNEAQTNPLVEIESLYYDFGNRILRGGSWWSEYKKEFRVIARACNVPSGAYPYFGLRLAM